MTFMLKDILFAGEGSRKEITPLLCLSIKKKHIAPMGFRVKVILVIGCFDGIYNEQAGVDNFGSLLLTQIGVEFGHAFRADGVGHLRRRMSMQVGFQGNPAIWFIGAGTGHSDLFTSGAYR